MSELVESDHKKEMMLFRVASHAERPEGLVRLGEHQRNLAVLASSAL